LQKPNLDYASKIYAIKIPPLPQSHPSKRSVKVRLLIFLSFTQLQESGFTLKPIQNEISLTHQKITSTAIYLKNP